MLGLVRGLVEWIPTSATWAGFVAGPLVLTGYAVGSIPFGDLIATRRFRRQLDRGRFPSKRFDDADPHTVATGVVTAAATLLIATVAWDVGLEAAPRGRFSAVGTYANQALGAWVSIAIWTGAAAVVGSMAPLWTRFRRGRSGLAPAAALLVAYTPLLALVALLAGALAYGVAGFGRRTSVGVGMVTALGAEYVLWITDSQPTFGITNGPETGLWVAALTAVLLLGDRAAPHG